MLNPKIRASSDDYDHVPFRLVIPRIVKYGSILWNLVDIAMLWSLNKALNKTYAINKPALKFNFT